ncbi:MAG: hypothetical protein DRJ42_22745 [Deltaproteobacteria bacterium]|nr:MAG: hypothetical protein DRJ42_22745 [Deltaproteobacteria bacterium]
MHLKALTVWPLLVFAGLAVAGCSDPQVAAELAELRDRVTALEQRSESELPPGTMPAPTHAHPPLSVRNLSGCALPESAMRVRVERTWGNCRIESFSLVNAPRQGGAARCPADFDIVVWLERGRTGITPEPPGPVRLEVRGTQAYDDGRVSVSTQGFECPSAGDISEIWVVPAGFEAHTE